MQNVIDKEQETARDQAKISFGKHIKGDFYFTVKQRVDHYFAVNHLSRFANGEMVAKSCVLFLLYGLLYAFIISNQFSGLLLILFYSLLGVITGLIGFNFSHDVMHNSYFSNSRLNRLFSYVFDLNGMSSYIWKITHNLHHHTYTNIPGHDGDIDKAIVLRLSPRDPLCWFHRYQHLYAPILYTFTSLNWILYSDYTWFYGQLKKVNVSWSEIILFFSLKCMNLVLFLIIPLAVLSVPTWEVVLGFVCLHMAGGLSSALVFQLAHVVSGVEFPSTDDHNRIIRPWAEHEMATTSNFGTSVRLWSVLFGGLNFQIEHHLFPYICHVHYPEVSLIVKETAREFGISYHELPTFKEAVSSHFRTLRKLGLGQLPS